MKGLLYPSSRGNKERLQNIMEFLHEAAPFLIGMVLPLATLLLVRFLHLDRFKVLVSYRYVAGLHWFAAHLSSFVETGFGGAAG